MFKRLFIFFVVFLILATAICYGQADDGIQKIRLNQVGFYPDGPKIAIVLSAKASSFSVQTTAGKVVFRGALKKSLQPDFAGNYTRIADFTSFRTPGKYVLNVPGINSSYPFEISESVHNQLANASLKAYYFMRASIPIEKKYAGKWARPKGHPDEMVLIHSSAATSQRPEGTLISSPGGWYDAGDYNKYIVNSGISVYTLLSLYEDFPEHMKTVKLNIPESGNGLPDLLNETLWNIRWMLTMQDDDGGVYHKLTNTEFDGMIMPDKATKPRYVVMKSTAATLDFAAVMAQSARIFRNFPTQLPGLADTCLRVAKKAFAWARANPRELYNRYTMNARFSPKITTGDYGDNNVGDEFIWAASELYVTTGNVQYTKDVNLIPNDKMPLPSWSQVRLLGYYSILRHSEQLRAHYPDFQKLQKQFFEFAEAMIAGTDSTAYKDVIQKKRSNFVWGSNSIAGNQGMALILAYKLSGNKKFLKYALSNLDYLLGRNGTGYCYVTSYGSKSPMHPHHRPSIADTVADPVPGLVVGGAQPEMQDHIRVPSTVPDEAYIDDDKAYATNEVAINWNAPLAYLVNAIEALQGQLQ
ncbi:MAG TPA: glycoside hydrolase family 9 protein [Mucilaginibacter sp.]|jgi:endoglucanase|nr:glycoside hydrolase family 9 protein [Mucilaginibacter sp.]